MVAGQCGECLEADTPHTFLAICRAAASGGELGRKETDGWAVGRGSDSTTPKAFVTVCAEREAELTALIHEETCYPSGEHLT